MTTWKHRYESFLFELWAVHNEFGDMVRNGSEEFVLSNLSGPLRQISPKTRRILCFDFGLSKINLIKA